MILDSVCFEPYVARLGIMTLISNKWTLRQCILSQAYRDIFSQKSHLSQTVPALCCTGNIYQHLGSMPPRRKVCC